MGSAKNSKGKSAGSRKKSDSKMRAAAGSGSAARSKARAKKASQSSEEKLRFIFESIGDGITIIALDGTIIEVNEAAVRIGGHKSKEELIGRNGLEFIKPEERDFAASETMKALGEGSTSETVEYTMVMADGSEKNVQVSVAPMRDSSGNLEGVITVTRDISERKVMEAELEKAAKKLRLIIESIGDMLFITDMDLNIVNANEAAVRMLGYGEEEELVGKGVTDMVAEEDGARVVVHLGKALAEEQSGGVVEYTLASKGGNEFDVEATVEILRDCAAKVVGLIITARDVTERKRMQEAVRVSEEKLKTMFGTISDGIVVIDMDGKIIDMNDAAYRLAGYSSKEEVIGINTLDFIAEEDREQVANDMMTSLTQGTIAKNMVYKLQKKDGSTFDAEFSASMLKDSDGNPVGFIAVERDVTERRRMEEELEKSAEKLRIVIESIGDMLFITDLDLNLTSINDAAIRLLGYDDKERLLGRSVIEHVAEKDSTRVAVDMGKALVEKQAIEVLEYTMVSTDGREFEVEATTEILRDCASKVVGLIVTARDVTERKRMQETVRASEEKLRIMFGSMHDAVILTDTLGTILDVNEASKEITGYSRDELIGKNGLDLISPEYHEMAAETMAKVLQGGGGAGTLGLKFTTADGKQLDAEFSTSVLRDSDGNPVGFVSIARDITERRRMEEAVLQSEEKLSRMFASMSEGIIVTDMEGTFLDVNEALLRISGYSSKEELIGKNALELVPPKEHAKIMESFTGKMDADSIDTIADYEIYTFLSPDGKEVEAEFSGNVMRDSSGNPAGFIGVVRDISERRRMEMELLDSAEKIRLLFESIGDGITVTDMEGKIIDANDVAVHKSGFKSKEEMIGINGFDLISAEERDTILKKTTDALKEGRDTGLMECTFRAVDGNEYLGEIQINGLRDASGDLRGFIATSRDISERRRMEEAVLESEQKLRGVFEAITDGITLSTLEGTIIEMNEAMVKMHGYSSKEELLGKSAVDLVAESDRDRVVKQGVEALKANHGIEAIEYRVVRADGTEFDAEFTTIPMRDDSGKPTAWVSVSRDITERKRIQEELRDTAENLQAIFDSMADGVTVSDAKGNIINVNDAVVRLGGFKSKEELIGKSGFDLMSAEDRDRIIKETMEAFRMGISTTRMEYTLVPTVGRSFDVDLQLTMLRDSSGKLRGSIGVTRDISERKRMEQALRESEEKLRIMFESMRDAVVLTDLNGLVIEVNDATVRMHGYNSKEDIIGRNGLELVAEKDHPKVINGAMKQSKGETPGDMAEYHTLVRADGTEFESESSRTMLRDADGKPIGFIAVERDISERRRMEQAVQESEARFRELFENMSSGVAVYEAVDGGKDFVFKDFNAAGEKIGKVKKEELIGKRVLDVYPGMEEFGLLGVLRKVWKSGKPARLPASYYKDDRREGWRDNYVYRLPSGEVIAVYDDITERKKAEDALIESEEKLRAMFESTSDGIVVTDVKFDVTDANEAAARIFGFKSIEELIGRNALGYLSTQKVLDADGKEVDIEFSVSQLRDRLGNLAGNIGVVRDISIRKRMEDNLRRTVTDLERSNRDMQQFVYVASHDLQEPLRMISSYTQLLDRRYKGKLDTDADEFITYAVNGANLLQERIQALATFSRVSTRGKPFATTDMERILEGALSNLGGEIEASDAEVTHDPLPTITADGTQMEQVFQYLVDNAIKFRGDNKPKVHISAEEREEDWVFSVSDNGIGIDPEYHDRIFVIFQRLYGGSYSGTGIGLPVSKKIMERHGGSIWVESEPDKGAKFYFSVPKEMRQAEVGAQADAEAQAEAGAQADAEAQAEAEAQDEASAS
jgi:PAS domain S-box-containing protein